MVPVVGLQALEKWTQGGMSLGRFINNVLCDILQSGENRLSAVAELQAGRFTVPPQFDLDAAKVYATKVCRMDVTEVTSPGDVRAGVSGVDGSSDWGPGVHHA